MSEVTFREDMTVKLVKSTGSDSDVVWAARVSTLGERSLDSVGSDAKESRGLIRFLMKNRHASPLEHAAFTFYIECPIFVVREVQRHRIASFNEESGRYKQLKPVFYRPAINRPLVQVGKTGEYSFEQGTIKQKEAVYEAITDTSVDGYNNYKYLLQSNVAKEVARMVLPLNIYTSFYMTINARSLMNFLSLRVNDPTSTYRSFPMREIEMVAEQMEVIFAEKMPIVHEAFVDFGRVAP